MNTTLPQEAVTAAASALRWSGDTLTEMATAALTAALPFLPVQVTVKKLEWEKHIEKEEWYGGSQNELVGVNEYNIFAHPCATGLFVLDVMGNRCDDDFTSVEAAKAAAQADYEARILSAIETVVPVSDEVDSTEVGNPATEASAARRELMKQIREGTAYGFLNDGSQPEGNPDLDCPYCCGSGHKGDVHPTARELALEEILREVDEIERKVWVWSGSAFLNNELEGAEDADCKTELYRELCGIGNTMHWLRTKICALSSPDHADAGKVEGDGRADLERFWRPISEADRTITYEDTFNLGDGKSMTIRNSDHYWVRDADGRVYEATWSDHKGGYWWDLDGESRVDPVEYMPHPLSLPSAPASEGAE